MGILKNVAVTATLAAYLATSAVCGYAQETKKTQQANPSSLEQTTKTAYKTVDDILGNSFQAINSSNYNEKTKEGKAVVMFYDSNYTGDSPGTRLARVYREVVPEFKGEIHFYKLDSNLDETLINEGRKAFMKQYEIKGVPAFIFIKDGERVFQNNGGPKQGYTEKWVPTMRNKINKYLK